MLTLLGFGSSARRGADGWTDRARVRSIIDRAEPDRTIDGASPSGGADQLFYEEACEHFLARGITMSYARRCPYDPALDGPPPRGFLRRNARQFRTHRPGLAAGFISGRVGSPLSSGSAHMLGICLRGLDGVPPCPVVVYRDDGVEPYSDLRVAHAQLRRLYAVTRAAPLVPPGKALASLCDCGDPPRDEVVDGLLYAADGSRWAPWIEAVAETVRMTRMP